MYANKRNNYIDAAKGLAIFLMLWGHCIQSCVVNSDVDFFENSLFKLIYSFHMPLFMLISGYLFFYSFSKRNLKDLLIHKTQSLLQPIIFSAVFRYLAIDVVFGAMIHELSFTHNALWIKYLSSLWFLWSVLAASICVAIVCKKCENPWGQCALLIVIMPLLAFFPNATMNIFVYPYFVLGFLFAKYKHTLSKKVLCLKYLSLVLFPVLVCFYEKKHYIYTTGLFSTAYSAKELLQINAYRWLIGLIGSVFALTVLQIIYDLICKRKSSAPVFSGLSKIGKKSLQLYILSVPLLEGYLPIFLPKVFSLLGTGNVFVKNIFVYNYIFTFSLALIYAFALYLLVKLLEKTRISAVMFGK